MSNFVKVCPMKFVLHHSKGTLRLSAGSREQAIKWSERQLGRTTGLFSVMDDGMVETIEKTGTGITAMDARGCKPVVAIDQEDRANSALFSPSAPVWH